MSRIKIDYYTSSEYDGPVLSMFKQSVLIAWGSIDNSDYSYAIISNHTNIGVVPQSFIDESQNAFRRAMLRKDQER